MVGDSRSWVRECVGVRSAGLASCSLVLLLWLLAAAVGVHCPITADFQHSFELYKTSHKNKLS